MVPKTIDLRSGLLGALMPPQFTAFLRSTPHKSCQRPSSGGPPASGVPPSSSTSRLRPSPVAEAPGPAPDASWEAGPGEPEGGLCSTGMGTWEGNRGLRRGATGVENRPSLRSSVASSDGAIRAASWARGARPRRAEPARTAAHLKGRIAPGAVAASSHVPTGAVWGVLRQAVPPAEAP